jgi:hypothetical protein
MTAPRRLTELQRASGLQMHPDYVAYDRDVLTEADRGYWDERIIDLGGAIEHERLESGAVVSWYAAPKNKIGADLRISAGKAYENMHDERRWATEGLARELRQLGLDVDLEIIERVPRRSGLGPIEWTAIFLGDAIATGIIHSVVDDVYRRAKEMLRARRRAGKVRKLGFRIYGPKNEVLKEWTTDEDEQKSSDDD